MELFYDGSLVRTTSLYGKKVVYPIKDLQILTGKQFDKVFPSTKLKGDKASQNYHHKFMTVIAFSKTHPNYIQDLIFFEREAIDCMESNS